MKKILFIIYGLIPILCCAQLTVTIKNSKDTLFNSSEKKPQRYIDIEIPQQSIYDKAVINIALDMTETTVSGSKIFLSANNQITVDASLNPQKEKYHFSFDRDEKNDQTITIKLTAKTAAGAVLTLTTDTYTLFIKPSNDSLRNRDNEFWIFTGTNLDLLDGVKANNLYARTSFLFPLRTLKPKLHLFYVTFEKNRFFSDKDSLSRIQLFDSVFSPRKDSVISISGRYSSFRQTITENIGFSFNYLRNFFDHPDPTNNFYAMVGMYIDYQKIITKYENVNILSDTIKIKRSEFPSNPGIQPLLTQNKTYQWNINAYFGAMYILTANDINIKSFATFGYNNLSYPLVHSSMFGTLTKQTSENFYMRFHTDATLLSSPGLSIGLETYIRAGQPPLFNFTLTKVIDLRQLGSLFGRVPSM